MYLVKLINTIMENKQHVQLPNGMTSDEDITP